MEIDYNEYAIQYEKAQKQAWQAFLLELERLQVEYKATKTEIINGLSVTRSKFYSFQDNAEEGLNITRSDVLKLWAYLCDTENRNVPKAARELRTELKTEGPNRLLSALGFASTKEAAKTGPVSQKPQIRRVVKRLESNWIHDDAVRAYITDNILDQVLDLGRPNRSLQRKSVSLAKVETWPYEELGSREAIINEKYERAVRALIRSGKTRFAESELFELYQSILEHHELGEGKLAKLRIVDCQFKALSQSISKLAERVQPTLEKGASTSTASGKAERIDFESLSKDAERELVQFLVQDDDSGYSLRSSDDEQNAVLNIVSTPCLEAEVRCQIQIDKKTESVSIRYRSTSTHVENMLMAMSLGLGHPLVVSSFSVRATGQTEKSLARISVGLSKSNQKKDSGLPVVYDRVEQTEEKEDNSNKVKEVYQGWWVSSNTITGILSATADAIHRWVTSENEIDDEQYYKACVGAAEITQDFYDLRKALYEYTPHAVGSDPENTFEKKADSIIEQISTYIRHYEYINNTGFAIQRQRMRNEQDMTRLVIAHASLISGRPEDAGAILEDMSFSMARESNPYSYVLSVYREACKMAYLFISGDEEFTIGKLWKQGDRIQKHVEELGNYIKDTQNISFDVYLVMSQLYGTAGILDFYSSPSENDRTLSGYTKSTGYLIQAAHYSLRIGHVRRAAQWLSFASRMCARVSSTKQANILHELSMSINDHSGSLAVDSLFPLDATATKSNWSEVSHLLAKGEIHLLRQEYQLALEDFLKALDVAMLVGYGRVMPDCLYDIHRAARALSISEETQRFQRANPFLKKWDSSELVQWQSKFEDSRLAKIIVKLIEKDLRQQSSEKIELSLLENDARTSAAEIWNLWKKGSGDHPCAKSIKGGTFLQALHE